MKRGLTYESLKAEFLREFPKSDYFTQKKVFEYMDMAYTMGLNENKNRNLKKVIRSDGEEYKSIRLAGRINGVTEAAIRSSIKNNHKSAGYFWKYA
jgi:hypothetical protein